MSVIIHDPVIALLEEFHFGPMCHPFAEALTPLQQHLAGQTDLIHDYGLEDRFGLTAQELDDLILQAAEEVAL